MASTHEATTALDIHAIHVTLKDEKLINYEIFAGYSQSYENIWKLIEDAVPAPLRDIKRVEVVYWDEDFEDVETELCYDISLEHWLDKGRAVLFYEFNGIEEEERGYLARVDDTWLPKYGLKYQRNSKTVHPIPAFYVTQVRSAEEMNRERKNIRNRNYYHRNKHRAHELWKRRYYGNHEESKRKNAEEARRHRAKQEQGGM